MKQTDQFKVDMGLKIRSIRKVRRINQDELASAINLTRTSLVNIEKGRQGLSAHNINSICEFLNISPSDIFPSTKGSIDIMVASEISKLKRERDEWKNKYQGLVSILSKLKEHIL